MMGKPVDFDDMLDVAFAEIYFDACQMEREGKIEPENTTEEFVRDCKQIAADYVEAYDAACKISEPCFYDDMYPYAEKRLVEMYPPYKDFTVLIDANMTYEYKIRCQNREEAEKKAQDMMDKDLCFLRKFRDGARMDDLRIGEVIEK